MDHIEVEYNRALSELEGLLSAVKRPGDFCVAGSLEIPMPRVEVAGVGALSFPILRTQVDDLVRQATQAPYGRGGKTIVDTSVRNVWQIAAESVRIGGRSWPSTFDNILAQVSSGLGCRGVTISAELYKLLVYERGGLFRSHRDTEKTAAMFGTLVITLPSAHCGGTLLVRHGGREVAVDAPAEPSEISFAAFYADCEHEVMPVLEGHRVCLIYNLVQHSNARALRVPDYEAVVHQASVVLTAYWKRPDAARKIAWLLDHQYTPAGLAMSSLKGADAARAGVLAQVAERSQCAIHLGVVHIGETGGAEEDAGESYRSRRRRRRSSVGPGNDDVDFTVITVDDDWQYIDEWRDSDDQSVEFGRVPLESGELLPAGALDEEPPDRKRFTEATGNEGATYERSYHRAALVLWPARRTIDVLLAAGAGAGLPHLRRLVSQGEPARREAVLAARQIVNAWPTEARRPLGFARNGTWPESTERIALIDALVALQAGTLLEQFVHSVLMPAYDGSENEALLSAAGVMGDARAANVLSALVAAHIPDRPHACARLMLGLVRPAFRKVAAAAVAGLDSIDTKEPDPFTTMARRYGLKGLDEDSLSPQFLADLLSALSHFEGQSDCADAAMRIAARPAVYDPVKVVVPALERLQAGRKAEPPAVGSALDRLWVSAAEYLLTRSEHPPQPPADWRLDTKFSCSCEDCHGLRVFARDPDATVYRIRLNRERRGHLHHVIDHLGLDMTHVTERVGSPQTLVCTKDRRSYLARKKEYQTEIAAMRALMSMTPGSAAAGQLAQRLRAAVAESALA